MASDMANPAKADLTQEGESAKQALITSNKSGEVTYIDRHFCKREVPMRVLFLGLGRTGTNSIRQAMIDLGYDDCYRWYSLFENPPDMEMWMEAFKAKHGGVRSWSDRAWERVMGYHKTDAKVWGKEQFDKQLGHCQAIIGNPGWHFTQELLDAYPDARLILQVRDAAGWYKSWDKTLYQYMLRNYLPNGVMASIHRWFWNPAWPFFSRSLHDRMMITLCKNQPWYEFPERGLEWYETHNNWVRKLAKEQGREILEYDVKEGWEPLCKYLGHPVPDKEFPVLNGHGQFHDLFKGGQDAQDKRAARNMTILATVLVGFGAAAAAYMRMRK